MPSDRTLRGSLATGTVAAVVALAYGVGTDLVRVPATPGVPFGEVLVYTTLVVVPFAVAAGSAAVALHYRVVLPLATVVAFATLPAILGWHADQVLVGVLVCGPLVVVVALAETLVRSRHGRLRNPPTRSDVRALSIGVIAAGLYFGVYTVRAALPLWRVDTGAPPTLSPAVKLALTLWYVLGASLLLVGLPVALNRRYGLLVPLVGLVAYLLVDLAYLQPLVAGGSELVVVLLLAAWPLLAAIFATVGAVEWWVRNRLGAVPNP